MRRAEAGFGTTCFMTCRSALGQVVIWDAERVVVAQEERGRLVVEEENAVVEEEEEEEGRG